MSPKVLADVQTYDTELGVTFYVIAKIHTKHICMQYLVCIRPCWSICVEVEVGVGVVPC